MTEKFEANWQFPDQRLVSQEIPVDIKGLSLQMKTQLQKPSLGSAESTLELTSRDLAAQLHIAEVSVDHVIEKNVGGIIGRFRVQAVCKDIVLNLGKNQGQFKVVVTPQVSGAQAATTVNAVDLSWNPGGWDYNSEFLCTGAEGFDSILRAEVEKIINDSASFIEPQHDLLKKYVQDYLKNVTLDFSAPRKLVLARPDIDVVMKVQDFTDFGEEGLRAKGVFEITFARIQDSSRTVLKLDGDSEVKSADMASLRLPKDFIKVILSEAYRANTWLHQVNSSQLPGFSTVMNSRFVQFFVWPALMSFSKSAKFIFDVYSNKDVSISGQGLQYQVKSQMYARMQAPKSGAYVPFMNFSLPFSSKIDVKVSQGKAQAKFVNPTLGMSASFDSGYVARYSPSRRFSTSTIRDKIVGGLWGQTISMSIPKVPVAEGLSLQVKKLLTTKSADLVLQVAP
ncbi:hypothetical protein EZJ49_10705 [Bdellovibrio bacteriovorus]|uniref:hypothetical protein n=1 Tax=Bdellovibrio bacteriovorus TaxID=959 RepID=UPI0021CE2FEC|nr:hypothetical protein [Bdellovibrio bacteriovorus]UXR63545.1 hypothetical protein EZJ49_10705 [Bdellovibrio bacteriovorus]